MDCYHGTNEDRARARIAMSVQVRDVMTEEMSE